MSGGWVIGFGNFYLLGTDFSGQCIAFYPLFQQKKTGWGQVQSVRVKWLTQEHCTSRDEILPNYDKPLQFWPDWFYRGLRSLRACFHQPFRLKQIKTALNKHTTSTVMYRLYWAKVFHIARACPCPGFHTMKLSRSILLPPGCGAASSKDQPPRTKVCQHPLA